MDSKRKKSARPKSAVSSRQLWMLAMKEGKTGTPLKRKPGAGLAAKQGATGYWTNSLRRSGEPEPNGQPMDTFTNLKLQPEKDAAFLSTPHYLRQAVGAERPTPRADGQLQKQAGRPAYKSAEEYYDDVIALKRELKAAREELSSQKSKFRRLEEESQKRDKQLEALFDPTKNAELRRALSDKNGDSALVVQSLKQRIFKLEQQLREKEATVAKLQSDIKVTKTAEMKTQLEVLYKEIVRLRSASPAERLYAGDAAAEEEELQASHKRGASAQKADALAATLRKVTEQKKKLAEDNDAMKRQLRELRDRLQEFEGDADLPSDIKDMSRQQLLSKVRALEKENDRLRQAPADGSAAGGKIALSGSLMEKVNLLDRRETELLSELAALSEANKRLVEERDLYKQQLYESKREVERLNYEQSGLAKQLERAKQVPDASGYSGYRSSSSAAPAPAARRQRSGDGSRLQQDQAVQKLQAVLRGHQTRREYLDKEVSDDEDRSGQDRDLRRKRPQRVASASAAQAVGGRRSSSHQSRPASSQRRTEAAAGYSYDDDDDIQGF